MDIRIGEVIVNSGIGSHTPWISLDSASVCMCKLRNPNSLLIYVKKSRGFRNKQIIEQNEQEKAKKIQQLNGAKNYIHIIVLIWLSLADLI